MSGGGGGGAYNDWESDLSSIIEKTNQNLKMLRRIGDKRSDLTGASAGYDVSTTAAARPATSAAQIASEMRSFASSISNRYAAEDSAGSARARHMGTTSIPRASSAAPTTSARKMHRSSSVGVDARERARESLIIRPAVTTNAFGVSSDGEQECEERAPRVRHAPGVGSTARATSSGSAMRRSSSLGAKAKTSSTRATTTPTAAYSGHNVSNNAIGGSLDAAALDELRKSLEVHIASRSSAFEKALADLKTDMVVVSTETSSLAMKMHETKDVVTSKLSNAAASVQAVAEHGESIGRLEKHSAVLLGWKVGVDQDLFEISTKMKSVSSIQEKVTSLEGHLEALGTAIKTAHRSARYDEKIEELKDRMSMLERQVANQLDSKAVEHTVQMRVSKEINELENRFNQSLQFLTQKLENKLHSLEKTTQSERIDAIVSLKCDLNESLDKLDARVVKKAELIPVQNTQMQMKEDIAHMQLFFERQDTRFQELKQNSAQMRDELVETRHELTKALHAQQSRVSSTLEEKVALLTVTSKEKNTKADQKVSLLEKRCKKIEEQCKSMQAAIVKVKQDAVSRQAADTVSQQRENEKLRQRLMRSIAELEEIEQSRQELEKSFGLQERQHQVKVKELNDKIVEVESSRERQHAEILLAIQNESRQVGIAQGRNALLESLLAREKQESEDKSQQIHEARQEIAQIRQKMRSLEGNVDKKMQKLSSELQTKQSQLDSLVKKLARSEDEASKLADASKREKKLLIKTKELKHHELVVAKLKLRELEKAAATIAAGNGLEINDSRLHESSHLGDLESKRKELELRLTEQQTELDELKTELREMHAERDELKKIDADSIESAVSRVADDYRLKLKEVQQAIASKDADMAQLREGLVDKSELVDLENTLAQFKRENESILEELRSTKANHEHSLHDAESTLRTLHVAEMGRLQEQLEMRIREIDGAQTSIEENCAKAASLKEENSHSAEAHRVEVTRLVSELNEAKAEVERLSREIEALRIEKCEVDKQLSDMKAALESLSAGDEELLEEMDNLRLQHEELASERDRLIAGLRAKVMEISELNQLDARHRERILQLEQSQDEMRMRLEEEIDSIRETMTEERDAAALSERQLTASIETLQRELEAVKSQSTDSDLQASKFESELQSMCRQLESAKESEASLKDRLRQVTTELSTIGANPMEEDPSGSVRSCFSNLTEKHTRELAALSSDHEHALERAAADRARAADLESQIQDLAAQVEELETANVEMKSELQRQMAEYADHIRDIGRLHDEVAAISDQKHALEEQVEEHVALIEEFEVTLQSQRQASEAEMNELKEINSKLTSSISDVQEAIGHIEASKVAELDGLNAEIMVLEAKLVSLNGKMPNSSGVAMERDFFANHQAIASAGQSIRTLYSKLTSGCGVMEMESLKGKLSGLESKHHRVREDLDRDRRRCIEADETVLFNAEFLEAMLEVSHCKDDHRFALKYVQAAPALVSRLGRLQERYQGALQQCLECVGAQQGAVQVENEKPLVTTIEQEEAVTDHDSDEGFDADEDEGCAVELEASSSDLELSQAEPIQSVDPYCANADEASDEESRRSPSSQASCDTDLSLDLAESTDADNSLRGDSTSLQVSPPRENPSTALVHSPTAALSTELFTPAQTDRDVDCVSTQQFRTQTDPCTTLVDSRSAELLEQPYTGDTGIRNVTDPIKVSSIDACTNLMQTPTATLLDEQFCSQTVTPEAALRSLGSAAVPNHDARTQMSAKMDDDEHEPSENNHSDCDDSFAKDVEHHSSLEYEQRQDVDEVHLERRATEADGIRDQSTDLHDCIASDNGITRESFQRDGDNTDDAIDSDSGSCEDENMSVHSDGQDYDDDQDPDREDSLSRSTDMTVCTASSGDSTGRLPRVETLDSRGSQDGDELDQIVDSGGANPEELRHSTEQLSAPKAVVPPISTDLPNDDRELPRRSALQADTCEENRRFTESSISGVSERAENRDKGDDKFDEAEDPGEDGDELDDDEDRDECDDEVDIVGGGIYDNLEARSGSLHESTDQELHENEEACSGQEPCQDNVLIAEEDVPADKSSICTSQTEEAEEEHNEEIDASHDFDDDDISVDDEFKTGGMGHGQSAPTEYPCDAEEADESRAFELAPVSKLHIPSLALSRMSALQSDSDDDELHAAQLTMDLQRRGLFSKEEDEEFDHLDDAAGLSTCDIDDADSSNDLSQRYALDDHDHVGDKEQSGSEHDEDESSTDFDHVHLPDEAADLPAVVRPTLDDEGGEPTRYLGASPPDANTKRGHTQAKPQSRLAALRNHDDDEKLEPGEHLSQLNNFSRGEDDEFDRSDDNVDEGDTYFRRSSSATGADDLGDSRDQSQDAGENEDVRSFNQSVPQREVLEEPTQPIVSTQQIDEKMDEERMQGTHPKSSLDENQNLSSERIQPTDDDSDSDFDRTVGPGVEGDDNSALDQSASFDSPNSDRYPENGPSPMRESAHISHREEYSDVQHPEVDQDDVNREEADEQSFGDESMDEVERLLLQHAETAMESTPHGADRQFTSALRMEDDDEMIDSASGGGDDDDHDDLLDSQEDGDLEGSSSDPNSCGQRDSTDDLAISKDGDFKIHRLGDLETQSTEAASRLGSRVVREHASDDADEHISTRDGETCQLSALQTSRMVGSDIYDSEDDVAEGATSPSRLPVSQLSPLSGLSTEARSTGSRVALLKVLQATRATMESSDMDDEMDEVEKLMAARSLGRKQAGDVPLSSESASLEVNDQGGDFDDVSDESSGDRVEVDEQVQLNVPTNSVTEDASRSDSRDFDDSATDEHGSIARDDKDKNVDEHDESDADDDISEQGSEDGGDFDESSATFGESFAADALERAVEGATSTAMSGHSEDEEESSFDRGFDTTNEDNEGIALDHNPSVDSHDFDHDAFDKTAQASPADEMLDSSTPCEVDHKFDPALGLENDDELIDSASDGDEDDDHQNLLNLREDDDIGGSPSHSVNLDSSRLEDRSDDLHLDEEDHVKLDHGGGLESRLDEPADYDRDDAGDDDNELTSTNDGDAALTTSPTPARGFSESDDEIKERPTSPSSLLVSQLPPLSGSNGSAHGTSGSGGSALKALHASRTAMNYPDLDDDMDEVEKLMAAHTSQRRQSGDRSPSSASPFKATHDSDADFDDFNDGGVDPTARIQADEPVHTEVAAEDAPGAASTSSSRDYSDNTHEIQGLATTDEDDDENVDKLEESKPDADDESSVRDEENGSDCDDASATFDESFAENALERAMDNATTFTSAELPASSKNGSDFDRTSRSDVEDDDASVTHCEQSSFGSRDLHLHGSFDGVAQIADAKLVSHREDVASIQLPDQLADADERDEAKELNFADDDRSEIALQLLQDASQRDVDHELDSRPRDEDDDELIDSESEGADADDLQDLVDSDEDDGLDLSRSSSSSSVEPKSSQSQNSLADLHFDKEGDGKLGPRGDLRSRSDEPASRFQANFDQNDESDDESELTPRTDNDEALPLTPASDGRVEESDDEFEERASLASSLPVSQLPPLAGLSGRARTTGGSGALMKALQANRAALNTSDLDDDMDKVEKLMSSQTLQRRPPGNFSHSAGPTPLPTQNNDQDDDDFGGYDDENSGDRVGNEPVLADFVTEGARGANSGVSSRDFDESANVTQALVTRGEVGDEDIDELELSQTHEDTSEQEEEEDGSDFDDGSATFGESFGDDALERAMEGAAYNSTLVPQSSAALGSRTHHVAESDSDDEQREKTSRPAPQAASLSSGMLLGRNRQLGALQPLPSLIKKPLPGLSALTRGKLSSNDDEDDMDEVERLLLEQTSIKAANPKKPAIRTALQFDDEDDFDGSEKEWSPASPRGDATLPIAREQDDEFARFDRDDENDNEDQRAAKKSDREGSVCSLSDSQSSAPHSPSRIPIFSGSSLLKGSSPLRAAATRPRMPSARSEDDGADAYLEDSFDLEESLQEEEDDV